MDDSRMIKTKFWSDEYISALDKDSKLLYLYLMTNERTSLCGAYEITKRIMEFDTGIDGNSITRILERLETDGKLNYRGGYIFLKNFIKNQNLGNPSIRLGIEKRIANLPLEIRNVAQEEYNKASSRYLVGTKGKERKRKVKEKEKERGRGGGKEIVQSSPSTPLFEEFWLKYPKKIKKSEASTAWESKGLDGAQSRGTVQLILDFIAKASQTDAWKKGMIPAPAKFIFEERWNDSLETYADFKPLSSPEPLL